jgi:hypothetical protein
MTAAVHAPHTPIRGAGLGAALRLVTCRGTCPVGADRDHHDRLLSVDTDMDVVLELMDLAVTWHELEHPRDLLVGPEQWETFAQRHLWAHPERAEQAFMLAVDIAAKGAPKARPAVRGGRMTMLDLVVE